MTGRRPGALAAVLLLPLTGCAGGGPEPGPAAATSDELRIGLTEWSIETGPVRAAAGDVELLVTNAGAAAHDLVVTGRHGSWATPALAPGEQHELRIRTAPGERLELVCTLTGHHAQGMHTGLPVEDGP